jgi:hypothetical protein
MLEKNVHTICKQRRWWRVHVRSGAPGQRSFLRTCLDLGFPTPARECCGKCCVRHVERHANVETRHRFRGDDVDGKGGTPVSCDLGAVHVCDPTTRPRVSGSLYDEEEALSQRAVASHIMHTHTHHVRSAGVGCIPQRCVCVCVCVCVREGGGGGGGSQREN